MNPQRMHENDDPHSSQDWLRILSEHGPGLLLFARQFLDHARAQDAVQEGFLRVWRRDKPEAVSKALLCRAVRTAALDILRSNRRRSQREENYATEQPLFVETASGGEFSSEEVQRALAKLPAEQREVVVLRLWNDLTIAGAAEALGIPPNTVASRYRLAISKLKQLLRHEQS